MTAPTPPSPAKRERGHRLVDLDVTIRVVETEIPLDAAIEPDAYRDAVRDYLANRVAREFGHTATVTVTATVREV